MEVYLCEDAAIKFLADHPGKIRSLLEVLISTTQAQGIQSSSIAAYLAQLETHLLDPPALTYAELASILHVAKCIGDGLAYDIYQPKVLNDNSLQVIKVEVKSTKSRDDIVIHLSENERRRILIFADLPAENWRLWLNDATCDLTDEVFRVLKHHNELLSNSHPLEVHAESWFLRFGLAKV